MGSTFRASMNWLHTWAGVVLGGLLFAIFWTGTLSVFDREIDRWMMPATRRAPVATVSLDAVVHQARESVAEARRWYSLLLPIEREPVVRLGYPSVGGAFVTRQIDPATAAPMPDPGTWAGTRFLFPFHFMLHISFERVGLWIVGLAGMAMMALCVSGVVIHRKIFADFFTFRADRKPRRLTLDLHNVTGVLGLPFHFVITLSGLIIFFTLYFPNVGDPAYQGDRQAFNRETFGTYTRPRANAPAPASASLDVMVAATSRMWHGAPPYFVRVWHPGDAASYVEIRRAFDDTVTMSVDTAYFDAATGALLYRSSAAPILTAQRFIAGLHFIQFRHWTLRWVYFVLGLAGCVLIATGYLFWLESRRRSHERLGLKGVRVVDGLTIGSVTGILIATLAFFVVNRLLPPGATFAGYDRAALEIWAFYLVWLATFAHAWLRPARAWAWQCIAIAVLAVTAVLLNWLTTGDHLVRSLARAHLWPIAGMDLLLLASAAIAALTVRRLLRLREPRTITKSSPVLPQTR
ncbi:PepSY-associated TM helix domain-containing protein [Reyranella sp.]|uniref:PepSY-associated TM helix domain-containing protein n=1 Tax=Reyranella sp. TaxID=1929291 RepID=UPI003782F19A